MIKHKRRKQGRDGFTLLEVLLATSLMAVGTVSVLVVLATAAGYATQRQASQRLTQVLEEARNEARTAANQIVTGETGKLPGGENATVDAKQSSLYAGYSYELKFAHVDAGIPERGFDVTTTITYGDGLAHVETFVVGLDLVSDKEFEKSYTYDEERAGNDSSSGGDETR